MDIPSIQQTQLLDYLTLLQKWNKKTNLTAIRDPEIMVSRQLLDSLSIQPYLNKKQICDIGAGAGLPGIPLAIINPEKTFTLIDSNQKKTRFMLQAKLSLQLDNVTVISQRVEDLKMAFDIVTCRAFASLSYIIKNSQQLLKKDGFFLCMKGQNPLEEIALLDNTKWQIKTQQIQVPNENAQRHLVILRNAF